MLAVDACIRPESPFGPVTRAHASVCMTQDSMEAKRNQLWPHAWGLLWVLEQVPDSDCLSAEAIIRSIKASFSFSIVMYIDIAFPDI